MMTDEKWQTFVSVALREINIPEDSPVAHEVRKTEWYKLAYGQFLNGASDRVLQNLLRRAALEAADRLDGNGGK